MEVLPLTVASLIQSATLILLGLGQVRLARSVRMLTAQVRDQQVTLDAALWRPLMATPGGTPGGGSPDMTTDHPEDPTDA